MNNYKNIGS